MAFWSDATRAQRSAFIAAWLGWILDAFDFTILILVAPKVATEFGTDMQALGLVTTVTLIGRVVGGPLGGWLCDRFGRRRPMMASLVLYALFDFLVAFSGSYGELVLLRFLFGIGMGAEWTSGTTLAMEHWPARSRGIAAGLLQGSWAIGYFLAALAYRFVVPVLGWRALFWLAAIPALLAVFIRARVEESPSWQPAAATERPRFGELLSNLEVRASVVVGSLVLGGGFFTYYALVSFYPFLIAGRGLPPTTLANLVMLFNAGMLAGAITCGALSERIGRRAAIALYAGSTLLAAPLYAFSLAPLWLALGAFVGGFVGVGWTGATPSYLAEHFPTRLRGIGVGTAYHIGALIGALAPVIIPTLQESGTPLDRAIWLTASAGATMVATAVWLRPERRGTVL